MDRRGRSMTPDEPRFQRAGRFDIPGPFAVITVENPPARATGERRAPGQC